MCPVCGKTLPPEVPERGLSTAPFCSDRCRLVDLGQWLEGEYRIPASEVPAPTRETDADEPE